MSLFNPTIGPGNPPPAAIYPTAAQFADSLENTPQTVNGITAIRVNTWGRLIVNVPSGTTKLTVYLAYNAASAPASVNYSIQVPVYVDGAYSTSYQPTVNGIDSFVVTLDGSAHTVEIWNGYEVYLQGTYVYAVQGKGISIGTAASVTRRLVVYGDSIACGGLSTNPGRLGWFTRLRAIFPGAISGEMFGGRQLWDDSGSGSGQIGFPSVSALAARLEGLCFGLANADIWLAIGINDFLVGNWANAAAFGADYAALLDAIHSANSSRHVYAQSMINYTAAGDPSTWRTAIQTACVGRSWVTFVDGTTLMTTGGLSGDGIHPTDTGHQAIALGTGADAGSASLKSILGI